MSDRFLDPLWIAILIVTHACEDTKIWAKKELVMDI